MSTQPKTFKLPLTVTYPCGEASDLLNVRDANDDCIFADAGCLRGSEQHSRWLEVVELLNKISPEVPVGFIDKPWDGYEMVYNWKVQPVPDWLLSSGQSFNSFSEAQKAAKQRSYNSSIVYAIREKSTQKIVYPPKYAN